ncbi:Endoribonuclease L-PSP [Paxillus ammoniavirescens]|nr:Endoribonuclease L-PSP [Paxillus ammoniavirescens]
MSTVEKVNSTERPKQLYSHAVKVPGLIFISGQTPIDKEGNIVSGEIEVTFKQCIDNITDVLNATGSSWDKVVKINVYLTNFARDFPRMNATFEQLIKEPRPARTTIETGMLAGGVEVEVEAIAAA